MNRRPSYTKMQGTNAQGREAFPKSRHKAALKESVRQSLRLNLRCMLKR